MNPAVYILATLIAVIFFAILAVAAYYVYDFAVTLRKLVVSLDELSAQVTGLPHNLRGIVPALTGLVVELPKHTEQLKALVAVIEAANQPTALPGAAPQEPPPPFNPNGTETNWNAEIPPRLTLREEEP
jgi:hypothetical protein